MFQNLCCVKSTLVLLAFLIVTFAPVYSYALQPGDRVQATANLSVRSTPAGTWIGQESQGGKGTIVSGPQWDYFNNIYYKWWKVYWDDSLYGWSVEDGMAMITSPPGTFTLSATSECDGTTSQIRLNWTSSSGATSYDVYRNGSLYYSNVSGTQFINSGSITQGTTYSYYIKAKNSNSSTNSNTVSKTALICVASPGTFTLSATPECDGATSQIRLNWTTSSGATSYDVYRNGSLYYSNVSGTQFINSGNITPGTTYSYYIKAKNSSGSTNSNTVSKTAPNCQTLGVPNLTSAVQKCDGTDSGIELQWTAVSGATNYEIYRGGILIYTTLTAGTTFWNVVGLTAGQTYTYQVKAKSGSTTSGFSNSRTATAPNCSTLGIPNLTSAVPKCDGTDPGIELQWTAVSGATNYEIYRGGILIYTTLTAGTTFWNVVGLTAGQTYTYQVKAKSGSTTSGFSNSRTATAPTNCSTLGIPNLTSAVPMCDGTDPGIELQWTAVSGATKYEIYRDGSLYITTQTAGITFWNVVGLTAGQTYTYQVKAKSGSTTSGFSNSRTATAPNCSTSIISDGFDYPVGKPDGNGYYVAQDFGVFNTDYGKYHLGEDWNGTGGGNTDCDDPVYSVSNGTIIYAQNVGGDWENVVIIRHMLQDGSQVESMYGHLRSMLRTSGDVLKGEQIGTIGDGNGAFYCHLHFEIRYINCPDWGLPGPGYSSDFTGWTDPSDFIDSNRPFSVAGYPGAIWKGPAAVGNFEELRGSYTKPSLVILHTIVLSGTGWSAEAALSRFKTPGEEASAHYIVKQNGEIWQVVSDQDTAYHAGNFDYNQRSIGIEMEGWADGTPDSSWQTGALYTSLQNLISWLSTQYNFPLERNNIIGHNQVPGVDNGTCAPSSYWGGCSGAKTDPGPYWNWVKLMEGLGQTVNYTTLTVQNSCPVLTLPQSGAPSFISVWPGQQFVAHDFISGYYLISISGKEAAQTGYISTGEYHWDGWIPSSCVSIDSGLTQLEVTGVFPGLLNIYNAPSTTGTTILARTIDGKRYVATGNTNVADGYTWREFYIPSTNSTITRGWAISDNLNIIGDTNLVSIEIIPANPTIVLGSTQQFTATGNYQDGSTAVITAPVTWKSSDTFVATIDTIGLATSVGIGTTSITASLNGITSPARTLTVTSVSCTYSLSSNNAKFIYSGGTNSVDVTAPEGCDWTATSNASWIKITSGSSGSGNSTVSYSVLANTSSSRTGTIIIEGNTFTVTQDSGLSGPTPCPEFITPVIKSFSPSGGTDSVAVDASGSCNWTASSSDPSWLKINTGDSGTGDGTVNYSVSLYSGTSSRTGTITIVGDTSKALTVTQTGVGPSPTPDIKANSSGEPITIGFSDTLSINISLSAGSSLGVGSDWWVVVNTPSGEWHYDWAQGTYIPGRMVTYQVALFNLGSTVILNTSGLGVGTYTFYFGVDLNMNGTLDFDQFYYDSVEVTVVVPDISALPSSHDFGSVNIGSSSVSKTFTISNTGTADLVIGTLSITGTDSSEFNMKNDNCSGQVIVPSGDCTVEVLFSPTIQGSKSANLSIPSNDPDTPIMDVPLTGNGGAASSFYLSFPLDGYTAYDAPISSVFDHSMKYSYEKNNIVIAYTGERGEKNYSDDCDDCFKRTDGLPFKINDEYRGASSSCGANANYYLCYDGHTGIDYVSNYGTELYPAISGRVSYSDPPSWTSNALKYHTLRIDPEDGKYYKVYYLHLSSWLDTTTGKIMKRESDDTEVECTECAKEGEWVDRSRIQPIGYVGDYQDDWGVVGAHLHFEVQKDGVPVDPYGWIGSGSDPYTLTNIDLWSPQQNIKPDIKANGSDGSITLGTSEILSVTVSLTSLNVESSLGVELDVADVDWWVLAESPFGWYYYDASTMSWAYAGDSYTDLSPTYQGSLFDLDLFEVLNMSDLPGGTYTFSFGVDTNMNGVLDFGELFFDSVVVNITP